ncbi:MAG: DNA polymerase III subunit gamma/tau [Cocleimonas sp.]|nr:DNA polymerase III subunit gamma/tau [Cocleimonas sp.]
MSYQVLARKWRPQNFKEMVGQQHVLKALINALDGDRLHHAYLFTGTRGVGKTTIARVLAKCLNCETGITSEPCGHCSSCQEITEGRFVDLIEVDAASRTRVEDTRELLDNVQYAPTRGRFKVYLIDEVHMLSGHSFNALLKTLEEPPSHVKFLFATTDPQKLPVTILSRCLQFNLQRMSVDMIATHLETILNKEVIRHDKASLRLVSRAADGSMRDALSLLDQAISFGAGELKEAEVREMLGTISHQPLLDLLKAVTAGDGTAVLANVEKMAGVTPDFEAATDALISLLHKMAVLQIIPQAEEEDEAIKQLADQFSKEDVQLYYQIALHGRRDLSLSPDPRSGFEMIFLRLLTFRPLRDIAPPEIISSNIATADQQFVIDGNTEKKKRIVAETTSKADIPIDNEVLQSNPKNNFSHKPSEIVAEIKKEKSTPSIMDAPPPWHLEQEPPAHVIENYAPQEYVEKRIENPSNTKMSEESSTDSIPLEWHNIVPRLNLTGRAAELITHCILNHREGTTVHLSLDKSGEDLLAKSTQLQIEMALTEYYNKPVKLLIETTKLNTETPAERTSRKRQERQQVAEDLMKNDPFVKDLQNRFNAQIVPNSVKPK